MSPSQKTRQEFASRTRPARGKWFLAGVAVLLVGAGVFLLLQTLAPEPTSDPPALVPQAEFAPVEPVNKNLLLPAKGFVRSRARVGVVSEVSGRIEEVAEGLVSGTRFQAGDTLVRIEAERYQAELREAQAAVDQARAELHRARDQVKRFSALEQKNLQSESRLEEAQLTEQQAQSGLDQAEATLIRAQDRLDDTTIKMPFDGQILNENVAVGRFVRPGQEIAQLFATDYGEVVVGLSERQVSLLRYRAESGETEAELTPLPGVEAEICKTLDGRELQYTGVVDRVEPAVDPGSQTLSAVVRVDKAFAVDRQKPPLLLDELVDVVLLLPGKSHWWRVPATALKDKRLWRLRSDQTLEAVDMRVLMRTDAGLIVESSELEAGDRVLLTDLKMLATGLKVRPRGAEAP